MKSYLGTPCVAFAIEDPREAQRHLWQHDRVESYGERCGSMFLHVWDEGYRYLGKCRICGGYLLVQNSEIHGAEDAYFSDYFPVSGSGEAHQLNEKYDGWEIESSFPARFLAVTNGVPAWLFKPLGS